MDKTLPPTSDVQPGVSIRNGPVQEIEMADANGATTNGDTAKRKSRASLQRPSYAEMEGSEDDDKPLVSTDLIIFLERCGYTEADNLLEQKASYSSSGSCCAIGFRRRATSFKNQR